MNNLLITAILILILSCTKSTTVEVISGKDGSNGSNGSNGHSLVSQFVSSNEDIECEAGGTRLDVYLDLDDSFNPSEADSYQGSLIACNGKNGLNGSNGLNGTVGLQGPQGVPGTQGPQGSVGPKGDKGPKGDSGDSDDHDDVVAGPPGPQGPAGPQGPQGLPGAQGAQGASGSGAVIQVSTSSCVLIVDSYYTKNNLLYLENDSNYCDGNNDKVTLNSSGDSMWVAASMLVIKDGAGILRIIKFN